MVVLEVSALKGHVGNVGSLLALGLESVPFFDKEKKTSTREQQLSERLKREAKKNVPRISDKQQTQRCFSLLPIFWELFLLLDGGVDVREGVLAGDDISSSLLGAMTSKCLCQLLKGNVTLGGGRLGLGSSGSSIGSQKE